MSKLARHTRFSYYVAGNHFESRQTACPDHGTRVAHRCNTFSCIIIINVYIIRDVQGGWGGCRTGNGKKLSNSQACCLAQMCLAAA